MISPRRCLAALMLMALAGAPLPALAVDSPPRQDVPDLADIRAKLKANDYAAARDQLLRLVGNHEHADIFNLLGFALRKTGDYRTALTFYQKALDFDPDHKGAHEYIGELFIETTQPDKARAHLARLMQLCPQGCEEREDLEEALRAAGIPFAAN